MNASPRPPSLRVVVVDDHPLFRGGLVALLTEAGVQVAGVAGGAEEGLELIAERAPNVVVMDLHLNGMSGIEAIGVIRERHPGTAVVVVTASVAHADVADALVAGASGYVIKDSPPAEIVAALHAALDGDAVISPRVARGVLALVRRERAPADGHSTVELSAREHEVLRLLVDGRDNAEIARALMISASTAKSHVSAILGKLGVENRVQAAVEAVRTGLA